MFDLDPYQMLAIISLVFLGLVLVLASVVFFTKRSKKFVFFSCYAIMATMLVLSLACLIIYRHYHGKPLSLLP